MLDHYRALIHDLDLIESRRVETPNYRNDEEEDDNSNGRSSMASDHISQARLGCIAEGYIASTKEINSVGISEKNDLFLYCFCRLF